MMAAQLKYDKANTFVHELGINSKSNISHEK